MNLTWAGPSCDPESVCQGLGRETVKGPDVSAVCSGARLGQSVYCHPAHPRVPLPITHPSSTGTTQGYHFRHDARAVKHDGSQLLPPYAHPATY